MWEGLIWHTWTQQEAPLISPLQKLVPLFSSAMAFAQWSLISKMENKTNPTQINIQENQLQGLPRSLSLDGSFLVSTILNFPLFC